jgi:3(or 17)beta-hydroxysteroid dehydrogenase
MDRVDGKIALVTGGAQGLGEAVAHRLSEEGARVVLTDMKTEQGVAVAKAIGGRFVRQDVTSEAGWRDLIANISAYEGGLHILVNNAGTEGNSALPKGPEDTHLEDWDFIFKVNAAGVFLGCKYGIGLIAKSGGGAILNFSSIAALAPTPFITAYGASKAAVEHLSKSVALHCAKSGYQIRCNSIHPGQIRTPMLNGLFARMAADAGIDTESFAAGFAAQTIPLGVFQEPRDIANAVLFLASDEGRYITGQSIAIDGGYTLTA